MAVIPTNTTGTWHRWAAGSEDAYGNPVDGWTPDGAAVSVWLEQTDSKEVTVDGNIQLSDWLVMDPDPARGVDGRDRFVSGGVTYEVVGPPFIATTPAGGHHLEARLRHVDA